MGFLYVALGLAGLLAVLAAMRWYANASASQVASGLRWAAIGGSGLVAAWLIATGRAAGLILQALPFVLIFWPALRRWWVRRQATRPSAAGQSSDVETAWLRMTLDHASGVMEGVVVAGPFKGRRLAELSPAQLFDLLAELRLRDADSAALLETYLDALHPDWRAAQTRSASGDGAGGGGDARAGGARSDGRMDRAEAARILGVAPDADREEVLRAWRDLMKRNHPDQGGSAYLAARINEAKETLLD
jgi:hypothetical protein